MSEVPAGWAQVPLADVADVVRGVTYDKKEAASSARDGYLPILRATNINGTLDLDSPMVFVPQRCVKPAQRMCQGDIVVAASSGSASVVGKSAQLRTPWEGGFGAFCSVIRPRPGIQQQYLAHFVAGPRVRKMWRALAQGTNINNLKTSDLATTVVPLPPLPEQERIAAAIEEQFSRIDAGVAAIGRARRNLRRIRAAVLQAAVIGRLLPQDLSEGSGDSLLADLRVDKQPARQSKQSARRNGALITDLPALPDNWASARWAAIGRSQNGRLFPSRDYSTEGTRLLRPGNLDISGRVVWNSKNTKCLPTRYASNFPTYLVGPNEIVMNLTAQSLRDEFLGRVCMTGSDDGDMLLNQRIARLTPIGMDPHFVFWALKSPLFRRFVDQLNTGSLIQHMFTSQLDEFVLPVPPLSEQIRIAAVLEVIMSDLNATEQILIDANQRGSSLRSSILDAAFCGLLVPHDPADEPASALIERIAAARASNNGQKPDRTRKPSTKVTA